jgi:hypothetical protein
MGFRFRALVVSFLSLLSLSLCCNCILCKVFPPQQSKARKFLRVL